MIRKIGGRRYKMRDKRPVASLMKWYRDWCAKSSNPPTLHQWLVERGKVYFEIRKP